MPSEESSEDDGNSNPPARNGRTDGGDPETLDTRAIHAGEQKPDNALVTPIYANATYEYESSTALGGRYRYSRMSAPTRGDLESVVANLEGATHAYAFASGMAAIDAVFSLLSAGDHVVAGSSLYAETYDLLADVYPRYGVSVTHVDVTDPDAVRDAVREETALVYVETPTNPLLRVVDIAAVADAAHEVDAVAAVDNTFASPALQRPLELGADLSVESLTKYLNGHSDAIGGSVATRDADLALRLEKTQYTRGAVLGPFESFLVRRGAKTLQARMDRHCRNAAAVADALVSHAAVDTVYYPGLDSHPGHEVAAEQMADFGGMVAFELSGGVDDATEFVAALETVTIAESLGGVESLVEVPAAMTHQDFTAEELHAAGIDPGLVRLSVGIEREADLVADVRRGLDAVL
ncbi:Cys/Met metabolism pyridoxal-phosphate-dependent protein [Halogeometricum pallidum JCM 14848]|uniref:Cys/Met metabolism pyridoxal-phosphate-dependent protein n=1 Tax=Halogeometricum pallidum JCM 14848 TaxID=1227487 RepID=M0D6A8_HALPD|nr:PLP-dependent aspartate aminotransferase family protein [Halogeometricum pallidum]ELZ30393.1 Cys/Met metabolism pyridoxal-phosphate-dependent protein [Halogeometricum pallidum JCM 14848]